MLPSSRVPGVSPGGMVMDEIDTCIIFTLSVLTTFSGFHVGRPTVGTKSFDSASNSFLSDGPTGYMTSRSSCLTCYTMYKVIMRWMK